MDTTLNRLKGSTAGNALTGRRSLQCSTRHILYHTTCCQSGGLFFPCPRCYQLEAVNNHRSDSSRKGVVTPFARANRGMMAGADPELYTLNTENNLEMKNEVEERTLPRIAKVHNILEMWQDSQNPPAI